MKACCCSLAGTAACRSCNAGVPYDWTKVPGWHELNRDKQFAPQPWQPPFYIPDQRPFRKVIIEEFDSEGKLTKRTITEIEEAG